MNNVKLSICLVNHNANVVTQNCIKSIIDKTTDNSFEIIVADNASNDGSVFEIKKRFPSVILINNGNNRGFAIANNQAIKIASGDFIVLLNNDTALKNDALDKMVDFMNSNPHVGIVTCKLFEADGKTIQRNCRSFPLTPFDTFFARASLLSKLFPDNPITKRNILSGHKFDSKHKVDWVSGAAMMIRKEVIKQIGLLDEKYFMYWEDTDYCKRAAKAGWEIWYIPDGEIIHYTGHGGGRRTFRTQFNTIVQMHRSAYYYFLKYHYKKRSHPMAIFTFTGMIILILVKTIFESIKYSSSYLLNCRILFVSSIRDKI